MFKKIEIWVLYLFIILFIIFTIFFGVLVRQELVGTKKLGFVSKYALFLAEIPVHLKTFYQGLGDTGYAMLAHDKRHSNKDVFKKYKNFARDELLVLSRFDGDLKLFLTSNYRIISL